MTSSLDMIRGRSNVVTLTNKSGGALVAGDVCIIDTSNDEAATTTTSAASVLKVYIAAESIANDATGKFYSAGFCPLVTPSASTTRGRYLFTHTVAKQAAESATYGAGAFGVILKSGTTPSVWLFGSTAQGTGGGGDVATDAIWDAAGDLAVGTGADTAAKLTKGSNNQVLGVSGAGAVAWVGGMQLITNTVVGVGGAANVTFSSIPGTFKQLVIYWQARCDTTIQQMLVQFNADTGNNYDFSYSNIFNGSVTGTDAFAGASALAGLVSGTGQPANTANVGRIDFPNYAGTTFYKVCLGQFTRIDNVTTTNMPHTVSIGQWRNTGAITAVKLFPASGNFLQGSTFTLYGIS